MIRKEVLVRILFNLKAEVLRERLGCKDEDSNVSSYVGKQIIACNIINYIFYYRF